MIEDDPFPKMGEEVASRRDLFLVIKTLGKGGYGAVYEVQRKSDGARFAMKCEKLSIKKQVLQMDCTVMLATMAQRSKHFARAVEKGKVPSRFNFIVMKLLGKSLWDLRMILESRTFSLGTSLKLAEQSLCAIENLHRAGFLHRDIKPGNFAVGTKADNDDHVVFMLDFGLCRPFAAMHKPIHTPRDQAPFRGTTRYASITAHKLQEQSRKDDIESLLYMVVEWTNCMLPWDKMKATERDEVYKQKMEVRSSETMKLEFYKILPRKNMERILNYLDGLEYVDIPDYKFIHFILTSIYKQNRISFADPLDWDPTTPYHGPQETPGSGTPKLTDMQYLTDKDSTSNTSGENNEGNKNKSLIMEPQNTQDEPSKPSSVMAKPTTPVKKATTPSKNARRKKSSVNKMA